MGAVVLSLHLRRRPRGKENYHSRPLSGLSTLSQPGASSGLVSFIECASTGGLKGIISKPVAATRMGWPSSCFCPSLALKACCHQLLLPQARRWCTPVPPTLRTPFTQAAFHHCRVLPQGAKARGGANLDCSEMLSLSTGLLVATWDEPAEGCYQ